MADEVPPPEPVPFPSYVAPGPRAIIPPTFSAFKPRDYRIQSPHAMTHVAWNSDGKKLAAVGIDKITRIWNPEKSMEPRAATSFTGGHSEEVDYVSWNPKHPELFCTTSQKEKRIVFWDARQSRHTQSLALKYSPARTRYAPDGRSIVCCSVGNQLSRIVLEKKDGETKESWQLSDTQSEPRKSEGQSPRSIYPVSKVGSAVAFNPKGDGLVAVLNTEHTIKVQSYPSFEVLETFAAHVGGCADIALDPRGRYLASAGFDSIVNLFDMSEWICCRTITTCDHAINAIDFSHDGEYLAIANAGTYIDICSTETGAALHRVPLLGPSPTVQWHPSKYLIAFCGQIKAREGIPPVALVSMFGLME